MRKPVSKPTLQALFGKSGNQCSFPGCSQALIDEKNLFIGQICHIESPSQKGPRYSSKTDDDFKCSYDNLILLCYPHHVRIDRFQDHYTAEKLHSMKLEHEKNQKVIFSCDDSVLERIRSEVNYFWSEIEQLNTIEHKYRAFAMQIYSDSDVKTIYQRCVEDLENLERLSDMCSEFIQDNWSNVLGFLKEKNIDITSLENIPYYENPFDNPLWEVRALGLSNFFQRMKLDLLTLGIKSLEYELLAGANSAEVKIFLDDLKNILRQQANTVMHVD